MVRQSPVKRFWWWLRQWLWALADALPPYRIVEGRLKSKETDPEGGYYLRVGAARVEVDKATFERLDVCENLRVRLTRGNRAVSIDRLQFPEDSG